jgi:hypothetical protein
VAVLPAIARQLVWCGDGLYVRLGRVLAGDELSGAFIFFGGALLALCWVLRAMLQARHLYTTSKAMGLTYLFVAVDHVDFWQLRYG